MSEPSASDGSGAAVSASAAPAPVVIIDEEVGHTMPVAAADARDEDNVERWCEVVLEDWKRLEHAPQECRSDPELVIEATRLSAGEALRFAADELKDDREFVLSAAEEIGPAVLGYASAGLRGNRSLALELIASCAPAEVLQYVAKELRTALLEDRDFLLEAVRRTGGAEILEAAAPALRSDRKFAVALVQHLDPNEVLQFVTQKLRRELQGDRSFVLQALRFLGADAMRGVSDELRADGEFMLRAVAAGGPLVLEYASRQLRQSRSFLLGAARAVGSEPPAVLQELVGMDPAVSSTDYWVEEESEGGGYWDVEGIVSDYQLTCSEQGLLELLDTAQAATLAPKGGAASFALVQRCSRVH